jgi:hypothetical protein
MEIKQTVNNPLTGEKLYFCMENKTLYTTKEIKEHFGSEVLRILETKQTVTVTVNTQPLLTKHKKYGRK